MRERDHAHSDDWRRLCRTCIRRLFCGIRNRSRYRRGGSGKLAALKAGAIPIYEPGLDKIVSDNVAAGRLSFTDELASAIDAVDAVFIAVGTPTRRGDGHADLTYVYEATRQIARHARKGLLVVTKSTVPVGTGREVARILREERPDLSFSVASNPEFLREGNAIGDFMRPDRVIIGIDETGPDKGEIANALMRQLYRPLYLIETPIVMTGWRQLSSPNMRPTRSSR